MTPKFFPLLRVMAIVQAAAFLTQAITAGQLLSSPGGRALHAATAIAALAAGVLNLIAAILVWRPGGGSARFVGSAAFTLAITVAQAALGMAHVKALHVPLGVLLFGGSVMHISRVMPRRAPATA
ncbi:hypothetical protein [Nonomuraea sp. NPDC049141]|uniref:hypothetical protein n=1 Tax=Nonomuraea sp. NPDC049141 TaxID=3155500 RepID=UPI0033E45DC0